MKFDYDNLKNNTGNKIIYTRDEGIFDTLLNCNSDINLLIGYINIGVDSESFRVNKIWGISPMESWAKIELENLTGVEDGVLLIKDQSVESGDTVRLDRGIEWKFCYDEVKNSLCIHKDIHSNLQRYKNIRIFNNVIATLSGDDLIKIWIKI